MKRMFLIALTFVVAISCQKEDPTPSDSSSTGDNNSGSNESTASGFTFNDGDRWIISSTVRIMSLL